MVLCWFSFQKSLQSPLIQPGDEEQASVDEAL